MDTLQDIKIAIIEPCTETTTIKNLIMEKHIAKINENIFLDGACDVFADALNKEYGYPIYELVNNTHRLIHAFCMIDDGRCIDYRGIFANSDELIQEYISKRKIWSIRKAQPYKIEPMKYSDIYTEEIISCAKKMCSQS